MITIDPYESKNKEEFDLLNIRDMHKIHIHFRELYYNYINMRNSKNNENQNNLLKEDQISSVKNTDKELIKSKKQHKEIIDELLNQGVKYKRNSHLKRLEISLKTLEKCNFCPNLCSSRSSHKENNEITSKIFSNKITKKNSVITKSSIKQQYFK